MVLFKQNITENNFKLDISNHYTKQLLERRKKNIGTIRFLT